VLLSRDASINADVRERAPITITTNKTIERERGLLHGVLFFIGRNFGAGIFGQKAIFLSQIWAAYFLRPCVLANTFRL
jgi:hypothetical protein